MKKYLLLIMIGLLFAVFSGCLQVLPPNNQGSTSSDIYSLKLDYLLHSTTSATVTGTVIYKDSNEVIIHDATSGIDIYDYDLPDLVNVGEKITVVAEWSYYYDNLQLENPTLVSTDTGDTLTPALLNVSLDNSWLLENGTTPDPTSLALWDFRLVTANGTLTFLNENQYGATFELEYPVDVGYATVTVFAPQANATGTVIDTPATVTGYLKGYRNEWELVILDPNDIEF